VLDAIQTHIDADVPRGAAAAHSGGGAHAAAAAAADINAASERDAERARAASERAADAKAEIDAAQARAAKARAAADAERAATAERKEEERIEEERAATVAAAVDLAITVERDAVERIDFESERDRFGTVAARTGTESEKAEKKFKAMDAFTQEYTETEAARKEFTNKVKLLNPSDMLTDDVKNIYRPVSLDVKPYLEQALLEFIYKYPITNDSPLTILIPNREEFMVFPLHQKLCVLRNQIISQFRKTKGGLSFRRGDNVASLIPTKSDLSFRVKLKAVEGENKGGDTTGGLFSGLTAAALGVKSRRPTEEKKAEMESLTKLEEYGEQQRRRRLINEAGTLVNQATNKQEARHEKQNNRPIQEAVDAAKAALRAAKLYAEDTINEAELKRAFILANSRWEKAKDLI
jgi:hypothetical protein